MAIVVREATVADADVLHSLRLAALESAPDAFRGAAPDEQSVSRSAWRARVAQRAADPDAATLVAFIDESPIGILLVDADRQAETVLVSDLWVDPAHRRRGVAHAMVASATEWGCGRSAVTARLAVNVTDEPAEHLFLECEFVPTGETEPLREGSSETVAWMERPLISWG